jgi:hypothetical protein
MASRRLVDRASAALVARRGENLVEDHNDAVAAAEPSVVGRDFEVPIVRPDSLFDCISNPRDNASLPLVDYAVVDICHRLGSSPSGEKRHIAAWKNPGTDGEITSA